MAKVKKGVPSSQKRILDFFAPVHNTKPRTSGSDSIEEEDAASGPPQRVLSELDPNVQLPSSKRGHDLVVISSDDETEAVPKRQSSRPPASDQLDHLNHHSPPGSAGVRQSLVVQQPTSPPSPLPQQFSRPSWVPPKWKKGKPESADDTVIIDALFKHYRPQSAKDNLRCLIKMLLDTTFVEQHRAHSIAELDSYAGGHGSTQAKIDLVLQDSRLQVSLMDHHCLVRADGYYQDGYDKKALTFHCFDCNTQHRWAYQRAFLDATFLGLFDSTVSPEVEFKVIEILVRGYDGSHVCHNHWCSDPFHLNREESTINLSRNLCRPSRRPNPSPCFHIPRCRIEMECPKLGPVS